MVEETLQELVVEEQEAVEQEELEQLEVMQLLTQEEAEVELEIQEQILE